MTEDEAKQRWCPFVRMMNLQSAPDQNPAVNRPGSNFNCIGSACMAFRWGETKQEGSYCGLAGKP